MRVPFWPQKDARLDERLNTVIERSEEVRKSIRPAPPRVVIDTSYVDQFEQQQEPDTAYLSEEEDFALPEPGVAEAIDELRQTEATRPEAAARDMGLAAGQPTDTKRSRPARMAAAAKLDALHREELARRETEAQQLEWSALEEVEMYRDAALQLEAHVLAEQEARAAAEAKLAEATRMAAEAQRELHILEEASEQRTLAEQSEREARARALAAQREAEVQRRLAEDLDAELEREITARQAAEAECEQALSRAAEIEHSLVALKEANEDYAPVMRREAEARQRASDAEKDFEKHRFMVAQLETTLQQAAQARVEAEARREAAVRRANEAERAVADLCEAAAERESLARREEEVRQHEITAQAAADAQRELTRRTAQEAASAQAACEEAEREAAEAQYQADQKEQELAALQAAEAVTARAAAEVEAVSEAEIEPPAVSTHDGLPPLRERLLQAVSVPQGSRLVVAPAASNGTAASGKADRSPSRAIDVEAASNVGSCVPLRAKSVTLPAGRDAVRPAPPHEAVAATLLPPPLKSGPPNGKDTADDKPARRDRRVADQKAGSLWNERLTEPLSCIIRDKSASGAMLEIVPARTGDRSSIINVGDRMTLTIILSRERTTVPCEIMRKDGRRWGVKFCGQFHTEVIKARKSLKVEPTRAR